MYTDGIGLESLDSSILPSDVDTTNLPPTAACNFGIAKSAILFFINNVINIHASFYDNTVGRQH